MLGVRAQTPMLTVYSDTDLLPVVIRQQMSSIECIARLYRRTYCRAPFIRMFSVDIDYIFPCPRGVFTYIMYIPAYL